MRESAWLSFPKDDSDGIWYVIRWTREIVANEGYALHWRRKLHNRRRHARQLVTGLVVNERVNLPRPIRRRLRAVERHMAIGRTATLTPAQLAGWRALQHMIDKGDD